MVYRSLWFQIFQEIIGLFICPKSFTTSGNSNTHKMMIHDVKEGLPEWEPAIPTVELREMGLAGILSAGRPGRTSLMEFSTNKEVGLHPGRTLPPGHLYYWQVTLHFSTKFLVLLEFPHFFGFTKTSNLPRSGGWRLLAGRILVARGGSSGLLTGENYTFDVNS